MTTNYFLLKNAKRFFIILFLSVLSVNGFTQVDTAWLKQYNSAPNLVDYGRKIKLDTDANVFVCGHSFINSGQEGVTTIIKYNQDGQGQWVKFTEEGVNMEDFIIDN
ncbi:MAG: hypothetical protein M3R36_00950 [Bacteroidota bacterium]|nr:hypothetical protein [Bacteroidota bacterium]